MKKNQLRSNYKKKTISKLLI